MADHRMRSTRSPCWLNSSPWLLADRLFARLEHVAFVEVFQIAHVAAHCTAAGCHVTRGALAGYRAAHARRRPVPRKALAKVLPEGRSRDGRGAAQVGLAGLRRGDRPLG